LAEIQDLRAIPALSKALRDPSHDVRSAAAVALSSLDYSPKTDIEHAIYAVARGNWDVSVKMGAVAVEPLLLALESKYDDSRENAAAALGQIGDPRAVEALIKGLAPFFHGTSSSQFRSVVVEALRQICDERAIIPLTEAARSDIWIAAETVAAIRMILAKRLAAVDENGLHAVADLEVIHGPGVYRHEGDWERDPTRPEVDCSYIRDIAQRELARRAKP
jgi:hypothetical protein